MDLGLKRRSVLVTGGTGGIGAATARAFAAEGARVALTYATRPGEAAALADDLDTAACVLPYRLEDPACAAAVVDEVERLWDGPDVLVANAVRWAGRRPSGVHFEDVPADAWQPVVQDNLSGTLRLVQHALAGMRRRGWGRIVLVSSHVAHDGRPGQEFYGAAKSGLIGLARSLSWDCGPDGILVNVVSPGLTTTDRVLGLMPERIRSEETGRTPTGRLSSPEDIASAIVYLGSAGNANITGELVTVSGGR